MASDTRETVKRRTGEGELQTFNRRLRNQITARDTRGPHELFMDKCRVRLSGTYARPRTTQCLAGLVMRSSPGPPPGQTICSTRVNRSRDSYENSNRLVTGYSRAIGHKHANQTIISSPKKIGHNINWPQKMDRKTNWTQHDCTQKNAHTTN